MLKSFSIPPKETSVLIVNDEKKLKWISIDKVEVADTFAISKKTAVDTRIERYAQEIKKTHEQKSKT